MLGRSKEKTTKESEGADFRAFFSRSSTAQEFSLPQYPHVMAIEHAWHVCDVLMKETHTAQEIAAKN